MKIALVSFGHVDVVLPLFKTLSERGVDVELILCFALNRKSESILDFNDKKIRTGFLLKETTEELLHGGIRSYLVNISKVSFFIYHNLKLRSFKNFLLSFKLVKNLKDYDIIHFNGTNGVLPLLVSLLKKRNLVFTIHDIIGHSGEKTRFNFAERINEYIIKSKYPLVVQNMPDYNFLNQKYSKVSRKFKFIPFGILDVYREFLNEKVTAPFTDLLFFGRISPYKGIEYLISALEILKAKGIIINTVIAGQGSVYFKTDNLVKFNIVLINRYISNEELVALIEHTKIVVCPYTDATQSGVLMTAFSFNKPVIASDVGSFSEIIKDGFNGFLVPPKDSHSLALKIEQLISDPDLLEKMQHNIQRFTTTGKYSWSGIATKMQELYVSILSEHSNIRSHTVK